MKSLSPQATHVRPRFILRILTVIFLTVLAARVSRGSPEEPQSGAGAPVSPRADGAARPPASPPRSGRETARRRLGKLMIVVGVLILAYGASVLVWRDPATDLYARWKQHELAAALHGEFAAERATFASWQAALDLPAGVAAEVPSRQARAELARLAVARAANVLHRKLKRGKALGRIHIAKLGLDAVFVHGTRWGPDLSQGPGHYPESSLPGLGRTMAIAGHRTTFGAPFRDIDSLRRGNVIRISLAYATFHYRVFKHSIVDKEDWSIIRDRGFDTLVLSACHPLYSAKQRWVVFARLVRVDPVGGHSYWLGRGGEVAPAAESASVS
jgi:sortase A